MPPPTPLRAYPLEEAKKRFLDFAGPEMVADYKKKREASEYPSRSLEDYMAIFLDGARDAELSKRAKEYKMAARKASRKEFKEAEKEAKKVEKAKEKEERKMMAAEDPHMIHSARKGK